MPPLLLLVGCMWQGTACLGNSFWRADYGILSAHHDTGIWRKHAYCFGLPDEGSDVVDNLGWRGPCSRCCLHDPGNISGAFRQNRLRTICTTVLPIQGHVGGLDSQLNSIRLSS
eukprot:scaffold152729_cov27-Tisochrysis_lutea.AAC.1